MIDEILNKLREDFKCFGVPELMYSHIQKDLHQIENSAYKQGTEHTEKRLRLNEKELSEIMFICQPFLHYSREDCKKMGKKMHKAIALQEGKK